jgi:hypothetical protein
LYTYTHILMHRYTYTRIHTYTHIYTKVFQATSLVVSDLKKMLNDVIFKKVAVSSDRCLLSKK